MPVWLQILLALGGSALIGLVVKDIYESIKTNSKKHQELVKKEKQNEMREVIQEENASIKDELKDVKEDLSLVKDGLQKDLYGDLVRIYSEYKDKKFATIEEKRDYDALYRSYHNLGQNGVADGMHKYVMETLPDIKPVTPRKPRKKKQLLIEDK